MSFMDCYQWVLTAYVHVDEADRVENKVTMQMEWTIKDCFTKLSKTINDVILYAQFANVPIPE